jgi:CubicO group peptidase (beta-lactamase class C family)
MSGTSLPSRKLFQHRASSPTPSSHEPVPLIDVLQLKHRERIGRFQEISGTPELTIHHQTAGGAAQTVAFQADVSKSNSAKEADATILNRPFPVGSYAKLFLGLAFIRIFTDPKYSHLEVTEKSSANELFYRTHPSPQSISAKPLCANPTILQLLLHYNGFAPMIKILFAPDGRCIVTEEEFLRDGQKITKETLGEEHPQNGWISYSNGNHIFAAIILERLLKNDLATIMDELVFKPLGMENTFMGKSMTEEQKERCSPGFHLDSKRKRHSVGPPPYSDTLEGSAFGAFSCIADIAKLHQYFLAASRGEPAAFLSKEVMEHLLAAKNRPSFSLLGEVIALDSGVVVPSSINQHLLPGHGGMEKRPYNFPDGSQLRVNRTSGYVDGYSVVTYHVYQLECFITVFGNSSGPLDVTDHIAHYILQESFQLSPKIDINAVQNSYDTAATEMRRLENQRSVRRNQNDSFEDIAGHYQHTRYQQQLTIRPNGQITIHGRQKSSGVFQLARSGLKQVCITAGESFLGTTTWSDWKDLTFLVEDLGDGRLFLINGTEDRYARVAPNVP